MSLIISCDQCHRILSAKAGDRWHWQEEKVLCSCCDPEGQEESDIKAAKGEAVLQEFKAWREKRQI